MNIGNLFSPPLAPSTVVGVRVRIEGTDASGNMRDATVTVNVPAAQSVESVGSYVVERADVGIARWLTEGSTPFEADAYTIQSLVLGGFDDPALSLV